MVKHLPTMQETRVRSRVRKTPGEGNGNPLQYSCLENPMDRVAWWSTVHGVAKSLTQLSNFTHFRVRVRVRVRVLSQGLVKAEGYPTATPLF